MSKNLCMVLVALMSMVQGVVGANAEKIQKMKESERATIVQYLEGVRDSVQLLTVKYYAIKQNNVAQRETDKEELDKLREQQEQLNAEMARVREESLSRTQTLEEERGKLAEKKQEYKALAESIGELYKRESDVVIECMPLDRESRRQRLEEARSLVSESTDPGVALTNLVRHKQYYMAQGDSHILTRQRLYPDDGEPRMMQIARFGNLFAYGMDTANTFYVIHQTGRLGAARFAVEKALSPELSSWFLQTWPRWNESGRPQGLVLFDVLQNDQSRKLVSGKRESGWTSFYESLEKGGWGIMIPMFLLALWAIILGLGKIIRMVVTRRRFKRQYNAAMQLIEKKDFDKALAYAESEKGVIARIVQTCLEHRLEERHIAERWIRDIIMQEVPLMGRGINTISVIAGAAPLLGLLGTISGMITLFSAVTHHGTGDPKFLAGGISEALITAKTGLAIAIPSLFLHDLLRNTKERLVGELERYSIMLMNHIWANE